MRDKNTLIHELQFMSECSKETVGAWWKSLSSEEKKLLAKHYKEMLEQIGSVIPGLSSWVISTIKSLMEELEPEMKKHFQEMLDMLNTFEEEDDKMETYVDMVFPIYIGWIYGDPEDRATLEKLGVRGEMVWRASNYGEGKRGVFEHCECTAEKLDELQTDYPAFWRGSFTRTNKIQYRAYRRQFEEKAS